MNAEDPLKTHTGSVTAASVAEPLGDFYESFFKYTDLMICLYGVYIMWGDDIFSNSAFFILKNNAKVKMS